MDLQKRKIRSIFIDFIIININFTLHYLTYLDYQSIFFSSRALQIRTKRYPAVSICSMISKLSEFVLFLIISDTGYCHVSE